MDLLVFDVFEPKSIGFPDPNELVQYDGCEQFPRTVLGLQHATDVQVHVVHATVGFFQFFRQAWMPLEQFLVDVLELLHPRQFEIRPDLRDERIEVIVVFYWSLG